MSQSKAERVSIAIPTEKTDALIKALAAHPYISALIVCLMINPFYLGAAENVPNNSLYIVSFVLLLVGIYLIFRLYRSGRAGKLQSGILSAAFFALFCIGVKKYSESQVKGFWLLVGGCLIMLLLYNLADTKKFTTQLNALLIFGISFILKFYYVFYTSVYTRQNDVHSFGGDNGHAAYMEYLLYNHKLPDFDVREVWQFCHPPLHHMICAAWIGINENILGIGHNAARESLQTLTLFYSMVIVITAYRILRHFRLDGFALYAPLMIIAFHPSFILLSGSINNDVLSVAFMMGAVLCTLKWYEEQTMFGILKIALCIGLGMMTKLSAALVAPPIAVVFLIVLVKKYRTEGFKLAGQFSAFALVCIPLGLWFEVKNFIKYRVPITYVQEMDENVMQYIGDQSFGSRVTDFSSKQFDSVFEQWLGYDESGKLVGYNEYNPLVALLKNSLFGESINDSYFEKTQYMPQLTKAFFWLGVLLAAVTLIMLIVMMFVRSDELEPAHKALFGSFYVLMIANFYKMAYDYPFTCTMNFRYITPTVIVCSLFCGLFINRFCRGGKAGTAVTAVITALSFAFAVLSIATYVVVCYPIIE